jgi:FixJ family two-component response regulator
VNLFPSPTTPICLSEPLVLIVDDDEAVREALSSLLRSVGLQVVSFSSASDLLRYTLPDTPTCLVLDVRLPGRSGFDLQNQLATDNIAVPIIFITGHGDIPMTVMAMKAGAVDFLAKPFREQEMLDAISTALEADRIRRDSNRVLVDLRARFESLTNREKEVLAHVTLGLLNKQIAAEMGISEVTVKIHRGHMMRKMNAKSVAHLVKMSEQIRVESAR